MPKCLQRSGEKQADLQRPACSGAAGCGLWAAGCGLQAEGCGQEEEREGWTTKSRTKYKTGELFEGTLRRVV